MARASRLFDRIQSLTDSLVDRSMAAALPTADPTMRRVLALTLLRRADPAGLRGLIEHWAALPPDIQATLVEHINRLHRAIREACTLRQTSAPDHAMALIIQSQATGLAYLLVDQLRQGSEERRMRAAAGLLAMARTLVAEVAASQERSITAGPPLVEALTQAVKLYASHKRVEVLLAVFWLQPRPMPALHRLLQQAVHPAVPVVRRLLAAAEEPVIRRTLLIMLAQPALAVDAVAGLRQSVAAGQLHEAMGQAHLLGLPGVSRALERVREPEALLPTPQQRMNWSSSQLLGLLRWIDRLPLEPKHRLEQLVPHVVAADRAVRLAALRRLLVMARDRRGGVSPAVEGGAPPVEEQIVRCCEDPDPILARVALRHLLQARSPLLAGVLARLVRSPHASVRELATRHLAPLGFQRLWVAWPQLKPEHRLAAGRALIKIDPHFHRVLAERLARDALGDRLRALNIIQVLGQGAFFEEALLRLAQSRDGRLVSAAVGAMEGIAPDRVRSVLRQALGHADPRVRANAIESLAGQMDAVPVSWLEHLMRDAANRPRANAIRALMPEDPGRAGVALEQMLRDGRAHHRVSGLWVIQSLGLLGWIRPVAEMAAGDPELTVRQRAAKVAEHLIRLLADQDADDADPAEVAA